MASEFLAHELDYILFFCGLALILLGVVCLMLRQSSAQRLPWVWLGLFGLLLGIAQWIEMLTPALGDIRRVTAICLVLRAVSYLCLLEFGRAGQIAMRGGGYRRSSASRRQGAGRYAADIHKTRS